ncbi:MAG: hypothetical protein ACHQ50_15910 [Fimbriimonadales bacterium]
MAKTKRKTTAKMKAPAKRKPTAKRAPVLTVSLPPNLKPVEGTTCGAYIRSLLVMGKATEDILVLVRKHFPESKAKNSDVSWNRGRLKAVGKTIPGASKAKPKRKAKAKAKPAAETPEAAP